MPRGSKPGERRGGRQRGTPNKKTALANAVLCAAAGHPDASPLEFMLGLVRDRNVPIDLRIEMAAAAAPFVHLRPRRPGGGTASARQGAGNKIGLAGTVSNSSAQKVQATLSAGAAGGPGSPEPSPLEFLLAVMHDPYAPPRQRIKAARLAAPYLHRPPHPDEMPVAIHDPFGFDIDPALAKAMRDDKLRRGQLYKERAAAEKKNGTRPDPSREEIELEARFAERVKALRVPAGYGPRQVDRDRVRLRALASKRYDPDSYLTGAEISEEAHLIVRSAAYVMSPGRQQRSRIEWLIEKHFGNGLTAAEQSELDALRDGLPPLQETDNPNYDSPFYETLKVFRKILIEDGEVYPDPDPPRDPDPSDDRDYDPDPDPNSPHVPDKAGNTRSIEEFRKKIGRA
jgi:hypothetical protein